MKKQKNKKLYQLLSIQMAKNPSSVILAGIVLINLVFICVAALIISVVASDYIAEHGFFASLFYTITMIMDAGCISYVVNDLGNTQGVLVVICVIIVLIGMIFFTGGIIGYVSNVISGFIDNSNAGRQQLYITGHTVILNWNSRASEIVNDLLYCEDDQTVVVLVNEGKEDVRIEIENRLAETVAEENRKILAACTEKGALKKILYFKRRHFKKNVTVIVRQGNTFSNKQLMDISVDKAKAIIILKRDMTNALCKYANEQQKNNQKEGDSLIIKNLVLVSEITANEWSADNQKIIVEVDDEWTNGLVKKIIEQKENLGKCNIVPVAVNRVLGRLLSQFSIMPELNLVYSELFSNRGAEFYAVPDNPEMREDENDEDLRGYLNNHFLALPLTIMECKGGKHFFFMADLESDLHTTDEPVKSTYAVRAKADCWQPRRNILILGHNSKVHSLMDGFDSYRHEWNPARDGRDILNICVVDDENGLEQMDYYRDYSYVTQVLKAELYEQDAIYGAIERFIDEQDRDTVVLILSDDLVPSDDLDANALTYLIYVQDMLAQRKKRLNGAEDERVDIVIEILNPQNYDVVRSYSADNVVISNRYISKMIMQIGEKEALFEFYSDILTYDEEDSEEYTSKELYIKKVGDVFECVPGPCTAAELIRAVYEDNKRISDQNVAVVLGYITEEGEMTIFSGDQRDIGVELKMSDKLIVFSNH